MRSLLAFCVLALLVPGASFAHGDGEQGGLTSTVERIEPDVGLDASVENDGHLTLTIPAGATVLVRGAGEEPDRRFAGGVVYERAASGWRRIGSGETASWHDDRTHWDGDPPRITETEPDQHHELATWQIGGSVDGQPFTIHGVVAWEPAPSGPGYEWISYLALGGGALYIVYLVVVRRRTPR